jgi:hypothetical protein
MIRPFGIDVRGRESTYLENSTGSRSHPHPPGEGVAVVVEQRGLRVARMGIFDHLP